MIPTSSLKWTVCGLHGIVRSGQVTPAVLEVKASLGTWRSFFVIFRANIFHDRELPRRGSVDGVLLDRAIDLCAKILYEQRSGQIPTDLSPTKRVGKREKKMRIRAFFREASFIAAAFFGAMYRFPFLVVDEDEVGRVAFCFEVCIPFTLP